MAVKRKRNTKRNTKRKKRQQTSTDVLLGAHAPGATPLTPDDLVGLKLPATTHGELNALEAQNILAGWRWALRSTRSRMPDMLTDTYLKELHKRMLGEVWEWAGQHRLDELANLGADPAQIAPRLKAVLDDALYWLEHKTYEPEEIAIRLHHRVVEIHPFRNGNGRHSRMLADLTLVKHFKVKRLPWGGDTLGRTDPRREQYLAAIRAADDHNYGPLLEFCTSS